MIREQININKLECVEKASVQMKFISSVESYLILTPQNTLLVAKWNKDSQDHRKLQHLKFNGEVLF